MADSRLVGIRWPASSAQGKRWHDRELWHDRDEDMIVDDQAQSPPLGRSRGLAGLGQLPSFDLPAAAGGRVRAWDYKGRRHLVLFLAGVGPDRHALSAAGKREPEWHAEGAALLFVVPDDVRAADKLQVEAKLPATVLADPGGKLHAALAVARPEILVADRNGTIYWRAQVDEAAIGLYLDEATSWLEYLNILEHECGTCVPAWPDED
jgi:peroxiredoxin